MKIFYFLFFLIIIANQALAGSNLNGCSDGYSNLVFDAKTQNILSENRANKISYPASLTKLMTLYLAFEALKTGKIHLDDVIIVSQRGEEISAINKNTTLHLKEGDKITVEQAIKGSIVKSFNEASVSLAEHVGGDEWQFVRMMNEKAFALGMFNTSFRNSTGFHEEGQYTTAFDLARLTIALRRDFPEYYPLFALKNFEYEDRKYKTHNHVLVEYKGAEGLKTGYTKAAGYNLISAAKKSFSQNEQRVISIVMGCSSVKSRDNFTKKLLDEGFDNIKSFNKNSIVSKVNSGFDYDDEKKEIVALENNNDDSGLENVELIDEVENISAEKNLAPIAEKHFILDNSKKSSKVSKDKPSKNSTKLKKVDLHKEKTARKNSKKPTAANKKVLKKNSTNKNAPSAKKAAKKASK